MPVLFRRRVAYVLAIAATAFCSACETTNRSDNRTPVIYPDVTGRQRSIVLDGPMMTDMSTYAHPTSTSAQAPWYMWRNDQVRGTSVGFEGTSYDSSVTFTYDRQVIISGRVRDHFTSTTYNVRTRSSVR